MLQSHKARTYRYSRRTCSTGNTGPHILELGTLRGIRNSFGHPQGQLGRLHLEDNSMPMEEGTTYAGRRGRLQWKLRPTYPDKRH